MYKFKKFKSKPTPIILSADKEFLFLKKYGKILDFTSGWTGFASLGHNNKIILNAIKRQMSKFCHVDYNEFENPSIEELSKKIINFAPNNSKKIWYAGNSGSEAIEAAMKLSYQAHCASGNKNKIKFINRSQSFHGATLHPLQVTSIDIFQIFKKFKNNSIQISQNNIYSKYNSKVQMGKKINETDQDHLNRSLLELENKIIKNNPDTICAMVGETQLGTLVGDVPPQKGYWKGVSKILKKYNIHLILDEVYCGMGRSGKMFNFSWDGIDPDFVCTGKGTTSGCIPFSFVMAQKKFETMILNKFGRVNLGHTFQGHSLGVAATHAVIDIIKNKKLLNRVEKLGKYMQKILTSELRDDHFFSNVRGRGFAIALEHNVKKQILFSNDLKQTMLNKHKILINSKFHRTSFLPAYTMEKKLIDKTLDRFINTFKKLSTDNYRKYK
jgi:adenosylmethionine-8-amino-7-oxononanoate aminotransferase